MAQDDVNVARHKCGRPSQRHCDTVKGVEMPIPQIDVWRAANTLVEEYGYQAWFISAQRADAMLSQGDMEGRRTWMAVHRAVEELLRTTRADGEREN